ncbi:16S rRNA (cytosine(967)-C(5))-methyltransferase [Williamsoniiplasma somnilux]|uniref:16S rRNA (cytosine(967)-C(5))-methyltransferase n=1 Tax=Williamsoniiplasma somnilux TaxID=215578 RepID=A0A2K8NYG6_9MOLU|nr:16S rRNA (cytosine(967)-C(5))-methyltransferase RsmB [Williamsoniiplasma somnilux]ATZ18596.1 16S rRNA (cytosine(967)-C(5))-methyltransferase [Williamsoniiplasma somnilux]
MKNNSRVIAWNLLKKVFIHNNFSNILLNEISKQDLEDKFKNLIFAIVHGTITYKIYLQHLSDKLIDSKKTPIEIQIIIWMSIYQLRFLQAIPRYAILNEAVNMAKSVNPKFAGFVNACLQKILREENTFYNIDIKSPTLKFCIENSFPHELYLKILADYGEGIAQKVVENSLTKPLISFRVNTLKISSDKFWNNYHEQLALVKTKVTDCFTTDQSIVKTDIFKNGLITIQDQASILVGNTLSPKLNSRVLDMCSAPGGKLTHLAAIMNNTGKIIGYEIADNKFKYIQENILRLGVTNVELICSDATKINDSQGFDYILLDAPCSGFGVLKRKPEIKNNFNIKSVNEITIIQKQLLVTAFANLKTQGTLVYSTCTINKEENQKQIEEFIKHYPNMTIISEQQLFGFEDNTDGFYICKMQKQ